MKRVERPKDRNNDRRLTVDAVMALESCSRYPRERVESLWAGRGGLTALEVLDLAIPAADRLWMVLRPWALSARQLRLFAVDCVERALQHEHDAGRPADRRSRNVIEVVRRFVSDEASVEELSTAEDAAWAAAAWAVKINATLERPMVAVARAAALAADPTATGAAVAVVARVTAAWTALAAALRRETMLAAQDAKKAERDWQVARVRYYLREEVER